MDGSSSACDQSSGEDPGEKIKNHLLSSIEVMPVRELFKLAKELGITATTTWDLRQKLCVENMKANGSIIDLSGYTQSAMQEKEGTIVEDEKRRKKLEIYLEEIKAIYTTIMGFKKIKEHIKGDIVIMERDDPLIDFIKNEMKTVGEDFETMSEIVKKKPNCTLLICGDSGAGKSSFINLLVGEPLLPTSIRSNSSCQVRMTHSEVERAEIVDNNLERIIIDKLDFSTKLGDFLENIHDRDTLSCQSATIYLKSVILEGGLDIYDTIGLGETEKFNNELRKELNYITGIIFLLKKNNPIGDTTIGGLSEMIHQLASKGLPLGSMNFIINMCDLLQGEKEREDLRKNVLEQLRDKCTLIDPEVRTFSTKQELDFQKNNVMSKNYKEIIELIHQLHISSINTNTVKVFSFILKFVQQTIDQINDLEKYSASDRIERREYILRLRNLEHDRKLINQGFRNDNRKLLTEEKKACKKKVDEHFRKNETKVSVIQEILNRQNLLYGMTKIDDINLKIEEITHEEISKSFKHFIESKSILKSCCDKMLTKFIDQFAEHQKKKEDIHRAMNRHIDSVLGVIEIDYKNIVASQTHDKGFLHLISPILVPIITIKDSIVKASFFAYLTEMFNKKNITTFYDDTSTYVTGQASTKYSRYCGRSSNIVKLLDCLFEAPEKVTKDFETYLAEDMDYLAKNIKLLDDDMRQKDIVYGTYKEIKEKLLDIHEEICQFSLLRLHNEKKHIMRDKITFLPALPDQEGIKPILKNRNRLIYRGQVGCAIAHDSCIMVYRDKDKKPWRASYEEYRKHNEISGIKLRKEYTEVSKHFLDLQRHVIFCMDFEEEMRPTFLVSGIESSLAIFIDDKRRQLEAENDDKEQKLFNEICVLLKQILLGLEYLHSKNLTHYDLTGESIGYSSYGLIKLSSVSLPTKVKINYEKHSRNYLYKIVHLPVSILDSEVNALYDTSSDMYCLGILIYKMWSGMNPFIDVIEETPLETVEEFVNMVKLKGIDRLILKDVFMHDFGQLMSVWSSQCRDGKITPTQFLQEFKMPRFLGRKIDPS